MSDGIAIKVENLSKCYHIYDQPRDRLKQMILPRLQRTVRIRPKQYFREFWATKNVSFEVRKGETVGIIGRNGSGKSTLLQMICGTINPAGGRIQTNGRIAALLELGSGFNPEFTGRENVYLNGALLGLSKEEIDCRFDDIATFAEIGDFIERPVKIYSSGMMVRLAFSVAISVNPEVLVVDEALSVGDIAFQNKCMARIRQMSESGTTILFVTHDVSVTQLFCDRVLWLENGQVRAIGNPVQVCRDYYVASLDINSDSAQLPKIVEQQNTGLAHFSNVHVVNSTVRDEPLFEVGDRVKIRFDLTAQSDLDAPIFGLSIYRADGDWIIGQTSLESQARWLPVQDGRIAKGEIILEPLGLAPGHYRIALAAYSADLAICYGMTSVLPGFSVHADYPTWGKIIHPISWHVLSNEYETNAANNWIG